MMQSKKGQSFGLTAGLVFGLATLVVAVIIAFVVVQTLNGANLIPRSDTLSVANETLTTVTEAGETLAKSSVNGALIGDVSVCINSTDNVVVPTANWTHTGFVVAYSGPGGEFNNTNWKCSYTYTWDGNMQDSVDGATGNYTAGVDNISSKVPTILLIAAIVLILGILVLLVYAWQRMNVGSGV